MELGLNVAAASVADKNCRAEATNYLRGNVKRGWTDSILPLPPGHF